MARKRKVRKLTRAGRKAISAAAKLRWKRYRSALHRGDKRLARRLVGK